MEFVFVFIVGAVASAVLVVWGVLGLIRLLSGHDD